MHEPRASSRTLFGISFYWLSLSLLTDGMTTLVLPYDVERLSGESKATVLGLLTFVGLVVAMLVQPWAGQGSDRTLGRWGRRGTIAIGLLLTLASLAVYAQGSFLAVCVGFVLILASASVSQAGQQGFIPDLVPAGRRGFAAGLKGSMDLAGATLGFLLLGNALGSGGARPALSLIGLVLVGGCLLTVSLVKERRPAAASFAAAGRNPFQLDLRRHSTFVWVVTSRFLFLLGVYLIGRFFLFFVGDRLELNPGQAAQQAGALLGALSLITLAGGPAAGWAADRLGRLPLMRAGAILSALGALLLLPARSWWQILLFGALLSSGTAAFTAANWALTADLVPQGEAGRFFGLANVGTMGSAAAAGLFGPIVDLGNRAGAGRGYTFMLIASAISSLTALLVLRGVKSRQFASEVRGGAES